MNDTQIKGSFDSADLRNPQIPKLKVEKNQKGLTEILYRNDIKQYKDYIQTLITLMSYFLELFHLIQRLYYHLTHLKSYYQLLS